MTDKPNPRSPNWGGRRPGAGPPRKWLKLSRQEVALLLRHVQQVKKGTPAEELIAKLRDFDQGKK